MDVVMWSTQNATLFFCRFRHNRFHAASKYSVVENSRSALIVRLEDLPGFSSLAC